MSQDQTRIYLAAGQIGWTADLTCCPLLVSFAVPRQMAMVGRVPGARWMIDSGAFTCWSKGQPIDLAAYVEALLRIEVRAARPPLDAPHLQLDGYMALDVIPGAPGRLPTPDEADRATEATLANLATMQAAGLRPIPVYHEGEPVAVLDAYVAAGHPLIALGATASRKRAVLLDWLLPLFDRHPGQAFHGLAMTQPAIVAHVPFASVDSTTWLAFAKWGVKENAYLLAGRSSSFLRRMGIAVMNDMPKAPRHIQATKHGQMRMFNLASSCSPHPEALCYSRSTTSTEPA